MHQWSYHASFDPHAEELSRDVRKAGDGTRGPVARRDQPAEKLNVRRGWIHRLLDTGSCPGCLHNGLMVINAIGGSYVR